MCGGTLHRGLDQRLLVMVWHGCRLAVRHAGRFGCILRCLACRGTGHGGIDGSLTAGSYGGGTLIWLLEIVLSGRLLALVPAVALGGACHGCCNGGLFVGKLRRALGCRLYCAGGLFAFGCLFCRAFCQALGFFLFVPLQAELAEAMPLSCPLCRLLLLLCMLLLLRTVAKLLQQRQLAGAYRIAQAAQAAVLQAPGLSLHAVLLRAVPVEFLWL